MDLLIQGALKMGIKLSDRQVMQFNTFYHELIEWSKRYNLTAIVDFHEVQTKHFLDSLTLVPVLTNKTGIKILDIGSGAGFPGIPIKIACPDINLTLIDSVGKKVRFMDHIIECIGLDSVAVIKIRAENMAKSDQYRECFDYVVNRAIGPISTVLELSLPFCKIGGFSVSYRKGNIPDDVDTAASVINILGGKLKDIMNVPEYLFPDERRLVIIEKVSPTPKKYPRRAGIPSKNPL